MVKRIIFLVITLFLASVLLLRLYYFKKDGGGVDEKTLGVKKEAVFKKIRGFENFYNFDYLVVSSDRVFLYQNLDKLSGQELKNKHECSYLISGGFYDPKFKPIGLFLTEGNELSSWQENRLLNAIFSVNRFGTSRITRTVPTDPLRLALQSGPIVFENGAKVPFKSSAAFERRILAGVTGNNNPIFLVFWSENNLFGGPTLEELPYLIERINKNFGLNIADALNLDGGTASVFYGDGLTLIEANRIYSFFCVR